MGWLLLVPVVVVLAFDPGPLSGTAAARLSSARRTVGSGVGETGVDLGRHLKVGSDGSIEVFISDLYDPEPLMYEHPIRFIGQIDLRGAGDDIAVTRFRMFCCAADAVPATAIVTTSARLEPGTWVSVVGTFRRGTVPWREGETTAPAVTAAEVTPTDEPEMPYEIR